MFDVATIVNSQLVQLSIHKSLGDDGNATHQWHAHANQKKARNVYDEKKHARRKQLLI